MINFYKNLIKFFILITIIYIIYYNYSNTEEFEIKPDVEPYDKNSITDFSEISPAPEIIKSNQNTKDSICLPPPKKLPPKFVYASQFDDIVSGYSKVVFSGMKNELVDATYIPRVVSKYVYPYIPQNYDISLENINDKPWNHHTIISSIPRNLKPKYDNVFYYELDNDVYMEAFNKTFNIPCDTYNNFKPDNWSDIYDATSVNKSILNGYNAFINYIKTTLNNSQFMLLKEDPQNKKPIQIVHDILINFRIHKTDKNSVLLHIEVLLYRENKYNGKHIGIKCVINSTTPLSESLNTLTTSTQPISPAQSTLNPSSAPSRTSPSLSYGQSPTLSPAPSRTNLSPSSGPSPTQSTISPSPSSGPSSTQSTISPSPSSGPSPIQSTISPSPSLNTIDNSSTQNYNWKFYILETELIGDVPEDMIAIFPVTPISETRKPQLNMTRDDIEKQYAGILQTTASGKVFTGFGDINTQTMPEIKQHIQNYINFSQKNIDYTKQISKMTPEQAVDILNKTNAALRHDVLSTVPSQFAAKVLLLMEPEVQKQALFEMDKQPSLNALYYILNPSKLT